MTRNCWLPGRAPAMLPIHPGSRKRHRHREIRPRPEETTMKPALPTLLLLSLAYTAGRPPQSPAGSLRSVAAAGEASSYTTPWADSSRLGDTVFHSTGRGITTVAGQTDSHWVVRSPVSEPHVGLPSGPSQVPPDSLGGLGFTATTLAVVPRNVL